jgi:hypothetical protein
MAPQGAVNGMLPVSVLQKNAPAPSPRGPKTAAPRLKLVLRRLPPGLTKAEFENILGEEWKLGAGKVDWMLFRKGKISKEYAYVPLRIDIDLTEKKLGKTVKAGQMLPSCHLTNSCARSRRPCSTDLLP